MMQVGYGKNRFFYYYSRKFIREHRRARKIGLLLEGSSPGGETEGIARVDGIGGAIDTNVVVGGLDVLVDLNVDAVSVGVGGSILPVERGEGRRLEDGRVEPEDAASGTLLIENDREGGSGTGVLVIDPFVFTDAASDSLARTDGLELILTPLTGLVGRADANLRVSLASSTVGSASSRARRLGANRGRDAVVARSEAENTNVPSRVKRRGDNDLSIGGISDVTVGKVEARRVAITLNINIAVLSLVVRDADGHGRGGVGSDRVVVPLVLSDKTLNLLASNNEIRSHLVARKSTEARQAFASSSISVAGTMVGARALVGAAGRS